MQQKDRMEISSAQKLKVHVYVLCANTRLESFHFNPCAPGTSSCNCNTNVNMATKLCGICFTLSRMKIQTANDNVFLLKKEHFSSDPPKKLKCRQFGKSGPQNVSRASEQNSVAAFSSRSQGLVLIVKKRNVNKQTKNDGGKKQLVQHFRSNPSL